ncbi:MAG: trypsin-like peptidase domain-containing protein [Lentisphaeraceae bacterium]|nr:trypsin-like peptidase domain-containing protein [Lentisphaeraceae bacterium]
MKYFSLLLVIGFMFSCVSNVEQVEQEGVVLYPMSSQLKGKKVRDLAVLIKDVKDNIQISDIAKTAAVSKSAVVNIYIKSSSPYNLHLLPRFLPGPKLVVNVDGVSLGSGFFIHESGYIITNNHVVSNSKEILAVTSDNKKYELEIVAREPSRDLALLKLVKPDRKFNYLKLNDNSENIEGEVVIAIGNPLGLGHTVSMGIISQSHRDLSKLTEKNDVLYLQTDAAINPGSSGGPLIALSRGCVGVNTAGIQNGGSLNFAIPAEDVVDFLEKVVAGNGTLIGNP